MMVVHAGTASGSIVAETANHRLAGQHVDPTASGHAAWPSRPQWGNFGVDEDGNTLGDLAKAAMTSLEGLVYVICGSIPQAYSPAFRDWFKRQHPRCNWFVEQWGWECCVDPDPGDVLCPAQSPDFYEYAALGDSYKGRIDKPTVPIRSRSGDPTLQMIKAAAKDRTWFPLESVMRTAGVEVWDPQGSGDFGGDPEHVGADGLDHYDGESVTILYTPPEAKLPLILHAWLHWNGNTVEMALVGSTFEATIAPQAHGTTVHWYLEVQYQPPGDPLPATELIYEPGGASAPADEDRYSFVAFTHYNPYKHGLPELLKVRRGGVDEYLCRKGVDEYRFDATETVQYELLNLWRFTLDYIGATFYHSPHVRAAGQPSCCTAIGITFTWSGSARFPHYRSAGKVGTKPLHNLDTLDDADTPGARFSWRGVPRPFDVFADLYENHAYPQDEHEASWLTAAREVGLEPGSEPRVWTASPPGDPAAFVIYWDSCKRSLQPGDVIDAVHVLELIDATYYLIDNGLWMLRPIHRRAVSTSSAYFGGLHCGEARLTDGSISSIGTACYWRYGDTGIGEPFYVENPQPDDWDDCYNATSKPDLGGTPQPWTYGRCSITQRCEKHCNANADGSMTVTVDECRVDCSSGPGGTVGLECSESCGPYGGGVTIGGFVSYGQSGPDGYGYCSAITRAVSCGWEAWVCGPKRAPFGPDAMHGNSLKKKRTNRDCPAGAVDTTLYSMGNRLGDVYSCPRPVPGEAELGFEEVRRLRLDGWDAIIGANFEGECTNPICRCFSDSEIPDPPGYFGKYDHQNPPVRTCEGTCSAGNVGSKRCCMTTDFEACGDYVWCALDLNLDGAGVPYSKKVDGYEGDRVPTLYAYDPDPTPDPEACNTPPCPLQTDCPCETADPTAGTCS